MKKHEITVLSDKTFIYFPPFLYLHNHTLTSFENQKGAFRLGFAMLIEKVSLITSITKKPLSLSGHLVSEISALLSMSAMFLIQHQCLYKRYVIQN